MSHKDKSHGRNSHKSPKKAENSGAGYARGKGDGSKTLYLNESTGQTNYPCWREEVIKEAKTTMFFHTAKSLEEDREVLYPRPKLGTTFLNPRNRDREPHHRSDPLHHRADLPQEPQSRRVSLPQLQEEEAEEMLQLRERHVC